MPFQPLDTASSARYSSAAKPTTDALTRIGRSLLTTTTSRPSAARFAATARIRVSLSPSRKPSGSTPGSVWFNSTLSRPPSGNVTGRCSAPCVSRRSSSNRSAVRAK